LVLGQRLRDFLHLPVGSNTHAMRFEALGAGGIVPKLVPIAIYTGIGWSPHPRTHIRDGGLADYQKSGVGAPGEQADTGQKDQGC
jgi:hypothetical protein